MNGCFFGTHAKNNEEYRIVLNKQNLRFAAVMVVGLITAAVAFFAEFYWETAVSDKMLGVYSGAGTGLFVAGLGFILRNRMLLKDEEKLKESRLKHTDERLQEIRNKSFRTATLVMLVVMYAGALIGGLFNPILVEALLLSVSFFLVTFGIAYQYYNRKM